MYIVYMQRLTARSSITINDTIVHFSDIRLARITSIPVYTRFTPSMKIRMYLL